MTAANEEHRTAAAEARAAGLVPWLVAGAAALSLAAGAWLSFRPAPAPPAPAAAEAPTLQTGRQHPEEFGFPSYPGAFNFGSLAEDREAGSTGFSVRAGTAEQVLAFYGQELPAQGWQRRWRKPLVQPMPRGARQRQIRGWAESWLRAGDSRELRVTAFDLRQRGSTAQVVLSWAPRRRPEQGSGG